MNEVQNAVSLHPYFKIRPGHVEDVKEMLPAFIKKTATEHGNLYYGFSANGNELYCREAYLGGEAVLAHLENVGPELGRLLTVADLVRLEVHGPADELEKLRGPMGSLKPVWFTWLGGVSR
jgi:hypothetical protein